MDSAKQFLHGVLSTSGYICIVGIRNGKTRQQFVSNIDEAVELAKESAAGGWDTYFACARFKEKGSRKADNVLGIRALYIDLDCGMGKPYADKDAALTGLYVGCTKLNLPLPTVVDSGRGIHGYWTLKDDADPAVWHSVAIALKSALLENDVGIDPVVTADAARILRIPGTLNYKDTPPAKVKVLAWSKPVALSDIGTALMVKPEAIKSVVEQAPRRPLDPITAALLGNSESSFKKIMQRTAKGAGCQQIGIAAADQANASEPLWRSALSIAQYCKDRDTAIHLISDQHPQYDYAATEKKANGIKGPYHCTSFEQHNPGGCAGCTHLGRISSPIQLGREIKEYSGALNQPIPDNGGTEVPLIIPTDYPDGYYRGANGGIYREAFKEDEDDELIYKYDLYCQNRVTDPEKGDVIQVVLKLPHDEVKKFQVLAADLQSREKARGLLASYGVAVVPLKMEKIVAYVINWVDFLERAKKSEKSHTQMGWTAQDSFVLGEREITPIEHKYTPPAAGTLRVVSAIGQKGSLENWERVVNLYGKPGMETQAFAIFLGFGVPIFKFSGLEGAVFNMVSRDSGTGKSTVLNAINSIYGHPKKLMSIWSDTGNALIHNLGIMNNLPACTDEVTTWDGKRVGEYAYAVSQGRGKHRMERGINAERMNDTTWQLVSICTSNTSMYDRMAETKQSFEGEKYRIFETTVPPTSTISKEEADRTFHLFSENYGHAGALFIDFVVKHRTEVAEKFMEVRRTFDAAANMTGRERYWSAMIAAGLTAGIIVQRDLGLMQEINFMKIYEHMIGVVQSVRLTTASAAAAPADILGSYLNKLVANNTLIIDNIDDPRMKVNKNIAPAPYREPRGELVVRYEKNIQRVFIPRAHFRAYCSKVSIPFAEIVKGLTGRRILIDTVKKRLGKGSMFNTPPVDCFVLDAAHPEFTVDIDDEIAQADASSSTA